jgi:hypothetical protein
MYNCNASGAKNFLSWRSLEMPCWTPDLRDDVVQAAKRKKFAARTRGNFKIRSVSVMPKNFDRAEKLPFAHVRRIFKRKILYLWRGKNTARLVNLAIRRRMQGAISRTPSFARLKAAHLYSTFASRPLIESGAAIFHA